MIGEEETVFFLAVVVRARRSSALGGQEAEKGV